MTSATVQNLNLQACLSPWQDMRNNYQTQIPELSPVSSAYENNLRRVYLFTAFPAALVNATKTLTEVTAEIRFKHRQDLKSGIRKPIQLSAEIQAAIDKDAGLRETILKGGGKSAQELLQREINIGFRAMNEFLSGDLYEAAHAWLSAQLTGTWTAFEAMTEELWVAALNVHPSGLAELSAGKRAPSERRKVDFKYFNIYGYDLSSKMGLVLKEKYSFDRLEGIREAYTDAWFENDQAILEAINNRALDALAETRHVIIHNGGIVDQKYLDRQSCLPQALVVPVGAALPLDGAVTAQLTNPVMRLGWTMIMLVDAWLSNRRDRP
jgi:hypothetical protein